MKSTEVRDHDGKLLGWLDHQHDGQSMVFHKPAEFSVDADQREDWLQIIIHMKRFMFEAWMVAPDEFNVIRETTAFRPLITREMAVDAAKSALALHATWHGDERRHDEQLDEYAEEAVKVALGETRRW